MTRQPYPTDLTDEQWLLVEPLIPPAKPGGRDREADMREVVNAVLHLVRGGHAWRLIPHDFGVHWNTCYQYYRGLVKDGTWTSIHDALRERVRAADGREPTPSAAILDSQTVKTTKKGVRRSATTPARRSRAASATCSSTPSGW
jgi:putative transposase